MKILFCWKYSPDENPNEGADVIIGLAFGANEKNRGQDPGKSNEAIAGIIKELDSRKKLPIIAQREVSEALIKSGLKTDLVISERDNQFHIDSYEVLNRAYEYCKSKNLKTAVIVAHPAHILRCKWVAEKMGFRVKLPDVSSVPYEPTSKQWWTRNKLFYFVWEVRARIGWKLLGHL